MSILIKGMKMPKNCRECLCWFQYGDSRLVNNYCSALNNYDLADYDIFKERHKDCPIVELPPHGDLIDRSKLAWTPIDITDLRLNECLPVYLKEDVDSAPIVVESEE